MRIRVTHRLTQECDYDVEELARLANLPATIIIELLANGLTEEALVHKMIQYEQMGFQVDDTAEITDENGKSFHRLSSGSLGVLSKHLDSNVDPSFDDNEEWSFVEVQDEVE